jgi:iron complex outermembrane receptor protein
MLETARLRRLLGATASGALAAGLLATPAMAQDPAPAVEEQAGLEEIVVTAQRRSENLQDVPIAVSAVTAATLERTGIEATRDLPQVVPSVQFTRSGPSGLFFVRGVGTTNAAAGEEGANAVYVDGVYMADLGQTINYFNNIERLEVLKGPQGTLFGRNATGGLIHVITREPGRDTVMTGEIGYANYNTIHARAYAAGPLSETISADIALTTSHQDRGWGKNFVTQTDNKFHTYYGARAKIVGRLSDDVKVTLSGDYLNSRDNPVGWRIADETIGGTYLSNGTFVGGCRGPGAPTTTVTCPLSFIADDHDTTANRASLTKQEIYGGSLTVEADIGFATLTSISAYRQTKTDSDFDVDGGPLDLVNITFLSGMKSFQQELRLASNDTEPFSWQIGGFYLNTKAFNEATFFGLAFAPFAAQDVRAKLKTNSYAVFGEATYSITPTTKITGGIRYTADRREFDASQALLFANGTRFIPASFGFTTPSLTPLPTPGVQQTKLSYNQVTWRVALGQELTEDINLYASVNRGFKSGSYSLQNPLNDPYLPQTIMAYEAGIKAQLFDRRLRVNLAGFHYDIDDYQVRSAAAANPGSSLVLNAATVKVDGVELEFEAAPTDQLRIFGGVTWLNSRYANFGAPGSRFLAPIVYPNLANPPAPTDFGTGSPTGTRGVCTVALRGTRNPGTPGTGGVIGGYTTCLGDVSGNKVSNAPEWALSLGATYTIPTGEYSSLRLTALYSYNDGYFFEPDNIARQDAYSLLNLSAEYRIGGLGLELWARNVTDTDYAAQKITTGTGMVQTNAAPRTYGVTLKWDID